MKRTFAALSAAMALVATAAAVPAHAQAAKRPQIAHSDPSSNPPAPELSPFPQTRTGSLRARAGTSAEYKHGPYARKAIRAASSHDGAPCDTARPLSRGELD